MTETTAAPATTSISASCVAASDFSSYNTDSDRNVWTPGKMIHLIKALDGTSVAIVLDTYTGYTQVGVRLADVRTTPGYGSFEVLVLRVDGDGVERGCWHPLSKVGTVIILGSSQARWTALRTYGEERSAAIRVMKDKLQALYPDVENLLSGCTWSVTRLPHRIDASFTPDRKRFPFRSGVKHHYWPLTLDQVA